MGADDPRRRHEAGLTRRGLLRGAGGLGLGLALAGGAAVATTACSRVDLNDEPHGGTLLKRLRDRGEVRIGFANEAPYSYLDKNAELTGEAAELAKVLFERLGVPKVSPVPSDFGALIPGLRAGLFDIVGAGMSITPERCEQVLFTAPEFDASEAFLVATGNPKGLSTMADVARDQSVRLGVLLGTVESDVAIKSGVPESRLVKFADQPSAFDGAKAGRVDAVALTSISLRWAVKQQPGAGLEVTEPYRPIVDGVELTPAAGGFAVTQDQTDFVAAFDRELRKLRDSGEMLALQRPFGFTEADVPRPGLTTEQLCKA